MATENEEKELKEIDPMNPQNEEEERALCDAMTYVFFMEYADGLEQEAKDKRKIEREELKHFAKLNGVAENSPLCMMFDAYRAGLNKGMEIALQIQNMPIVEEKGQ